MSILSSEDRAAAMISVGDVWFQKKSCGSLFLDFVVVTDVERAGIWSRVSFFGSDDRYYHNQFFSTTFVDLFERE